MSHWPKEAIEALIEAYKARPSLYVPDSPNYHSRYLRRKYEQDLSNIVSAFRPGTTPVEIRNKIQGLRTAYLHERKKSDRAEMLSLETYVPSLWYYDKLKFLDKYMRPKTQINASLNAAVLSPSGSSKFSHDSDEDNKLEIHGLIQEELRKNRNRLDSSDPLTNFDANDENAEDGLTHDDSYIDEDLLLDIQEDTHDNFGNVKVKKKKSKDKHSLSNSKKIKKKDSSKNSHLLKNIDIPETPTIENTATQGQIFGRYIGWVIDNIADTEITMNLRHKIMEYLNEAEAQYHKTKNAM